ncbi:hypothetical protein [Lacrimispora indolis]|uniref:hypothetical protein n=1 Tax=Lacrimispora indolis TaxID=69825 RepID=UPI00045E7CB1|nr:MULTISPECIES: hypothetical protein [Lachnospiraceae]MBE7721277.1 hypothetical protein [Lacrimispora celerecrescens]
MKNRYGKVMNHIEVTTDMRDRILNNINRLDLNQIPDKIMPFPNYKKYLSIAACFVILLVGSFLVQNRINWTREPTQQAIPDIVEYHSANELSKAVGFTVKEIQNIPFEVETVQYTAYWKELAEIRSIGRNNTLVFRMAARSEDVSGDYSVYTDIKNVTVNGTLFTLKGDASKYKIAVWQAEGYSYSVQFTEAVSEQEMIITLQNVE